MYEKTRKRKKKRQDRTEEKELSFLSFHFRHPTYLSLVRHG